MDALLKKVRELEEGHAELLKREVQRLVPRSSPRGRLLPPRAPLALSRLQQSHPGLSDRHCRRILQSLGQAVHVLSLEGKVTYWNRYAQCQYGYTTSEAVGQGILDLIVHPDDFGAANVVIQNTFLGKCWRGKFPVKDKAGERFKVVINTTPLYDDDGSLVGLICLHIDLRPLEETVGPSASAKSYLNSAKPNSHANGQPNSGSFDSRQPLQSAITSKMTTSATIVTTGVPIRTAQNCDEEYSSGCEGQYSEHDAREELTSSEASTPGGGAFVAEQKSSVNSRKLNSDDSGEGKKWFRKSLSSKAEAFLGKKGISWPWKGQGNDRSDGKNSMTSPELHSEEENDRSYQGVPAPEPIIIPDYQDAEYVQESKYEVAGSWWTFNNNSASSMASTASTNCSPNERVDRHADCLDYEILWEDLIIAEQVGQGCCGVVYHALLYGSDVAVKIFSKQEYSEDMILSFRNEVSLMKSLRHPNVLLFMGAVASVDRLCIVTEYLPRGSLFGLLRKNTVKLDPRRQILMAIDIARGMNYLHKCTPPVVHRDLKSSNLLVDKNWNVKVADFGLSRLKLETFLSTKTGRGTPQWMAPEVICSEASNEKCDVYSYGVVLWELFTQKIPWETHNQMQVIAAVGVMDKRLEIPSNTDPQLASIIESCWHRDPQLRPSFQELMERLRQLQKQYTLQAQVHRKGSPKMGLEDC